ncbi:hypothetical protein [Desulfobotulus mexicanus]|uniref:DUF2066 domain-containing protein n=1 Tax=Desulfobotulus mexicanus TaxID=2586642 RepID=A0A5Q4VGW0_9BACT|nr:hypothetical protein [Desulfobotulus mexicanus]TYT76096.1 hypothetical protein FIM25_00640 [Desulfobotulus mexicanus]
MIRIMLCGILLFLCFQTSWAKEREGFLVMDAVPAQGVDAREARNRAERAVLARAVERFVLESLPEARISSALRTLAPLLEENPKNYVRDFRILATIEEKGSYRMVARVSPDAESIKRRMKELGMDFSRLPAILFMVSEQGLEDASPLKWWVPGAEMVFFGGRSTEAMASVMGGAGFDLVVPDGRNLSGGGVSGPVLDMREARRIGILFEAAVVMAGRVRVTPGGNVMGDRKQSFRADVLLIALDTDTGDVLAEVEDSFVVVSETAAAGEREALSEAGRKAASRIVPDLQAAWLRKAEKDAEVREIRMDIAGENYLARFTHFRRILGEIEGLVSIERREITGQGMDVRVRYRGTAEELAGLLMGKNYDRFGVRISDVEDNRMRVTLVSSP